MVPKFCLAVLSRLAITERNDLGKIMDYVDESESQGVPAYKLPTDQDNIKKQ